MRGSQYHYVGVKSDGEQLSRITTWIEEGLIRAVIDRTFSLRNAKQAIEYAEAGHATGKVVRVRWCSLALPQVPRRSDTLTFAAYRRYSLDHSSARGRASSSHDASMPGDARRQHLGAMECIFLTNSNCHAIVVIDIDISSLL